MSLTILPLHARDSGKSSRVVADKIVAFRTQWDSKNAERAAAEQAERAGIPCVTSTALWVLGRQDPWYVRETEECVATMMADALPPAGRAAAARHVAEYLDPGSWGDARARERAEEIVRIVTQCLRGGYPA